MPLKKNKENLFLPLKKKQGKYYLTIEKNEENLFLPLKKTRKILSYCANRTRINQSKIQSWRTKKMSRKA